MITRGLLVEYLLMVGVPFLLLLGVLHLGRALEAPVDIQGKWELALTGTVAPDASCGLEPQDGTEFAVAISQSGSYVTATISKFNPGQQALRGRIERSDVWLESAHAGSSNPNSDLLRMSGTVMEGQGGKLIRGRLLMPRNVDCPPTAFEARLVSDR
jgi:hypothetical protein